MKIFVNYHGTQYNPCSVIEEVEVGYNATLRDLRQTIQQHFHIQDVFHLVNRGQELKPQQDGLPLSDLVDRRDSVTLYIPEIISSQMPDSIANPSNTSISTMSKGWQELQQLLVKELLSPNFFAQLGNTAIDQALLTQVIKASDIQNFTVAVKAIDRQYSQQLSSQLKSELLQGLL